MLRRKEFTAEIVRDLTALGFTNIRRTKPTAKTSYTWYLVDYAEHSWLLVIGSDNAALWDDEKPACVEASLLIAWQVKKNAGVLRYKFNLAGYLTGRVDD